MFNDRSPAAARYFENPARAAAHTSCKEHVVRLSRISKMLTMVVAGGALLQATAGCEETIGPLVAQLVVSLGLEALLGGLAT